MKNFKKRFLTKFAVAISTVLPVIALCFAIPACSGKLYEPQLPEELRKQL